ncbi:MAG TPA: glycosyltransferase [Kiloniellales bacterium]|nr:glycosyltransferase [Kiloniellales bacterium]
MRLAEAFQRAGLTQHIVMRHHPSFAQRLRRAGVPMTFARFGGFFDLQTRGLIRTVAGALRPQVALSYMSRATRFTPRGPYTLVARLGGYYDMKYFRHADHLVGIAPDLIDYFRREGWPAEKTTLIPNFVEDKSGPALPRATAPLVVSVGRLHKNKAFDTLLHAMTHLPEAQLWIAGEGPERPALEALIGELGLAQRVRLLGWLDDPLPAIRAADVYVVPSRHEPLGSVVLEGWMCARPMVAAASQGPRWLIKDGENGLLVPVDAPKAMAEAIARLLTDRELAARLATAGRRSYEAGFTEAAAVSQYLALFQRLIAERQQRR